MKKILISMPDHLATRMRATIPARQRSKTFVRLIENEIQKRERELYECALSVERDAALNKEMKDWDITTKDGIEKDETW